MNSSDQDNKQRNREIAHNEAVRQTASAVRVSGWAVALAIVIGVVAAFIAWAWVTR